MRIWRQNTDILPQPPAPVADPPVWPGPGSYSSSHRLPPAAAPAIINGVFYVSVLRSGGHVYLLTYLILEFASFLPT
jgi:hypothetical protein